MTRHPLQTRVETGVSPGIVPNPDIELVIGVRERPQRNTAVLSQIAVATKKIHREWIARTGEIPVPVGQRNRIVMSGGLQREFELTEQNAMPREK